MAAAHNATFISTGLKSFASILLYQYITRCLCCIVGVFGRLGFAAPPNPVRRYGRRDINPDRGSLCSNV
jgi:hypothetical protein